MEKKSDAQEAVFIKPDAPRSDWEAFKWVLFEPSLLENYSKTLLRELALLTSWRVFYKFIVPLVLIVYSMCIVILADINVPALLPKSLLPLNQVWPLPTDFWGNLIFLFKGLGFALIIAYVMALIGVLYRGVAGGIAGGAAGGVFGGVTGGFAGGGITDMSLILIILLIGFSIGPYDIKNRFIANKSFFAGLIIFLVTSILLLYIAIKMNLVNIEITLGNPEPESHKLKPTVTKIPYYGYEDGSNTNNEYDPKFDENKYDFGPAIKVEEIEILNVPLTISIIFFLGLFTAQYWLFLYPFYLFGILKRHSLTNNPYLKDERIWLPLFWVTNALRREATLNPDLAFRFVDFLLRYRPLQHSFASELEHIATATRWKSVLHLKADIFNDIPYLKEDTPQVWQKLMPATAWRNAISNIRDSLRAAENQTALILQQDYYENCGALIGEFEDIQKRETFKGKEAYYDVIEHWKLVLNNQLLEVGAAVKKVESITSNPYSKGLALSPMRRGTTPLFLDRDDIKEELNLKIQTSLAMPTFLIFGQRRVGKTSLLNFLPNMLPPSFVAASLDAQSMSGELSVSKWFREWRAEVVKNMGLYEPEWLAPDDWLTAWDDFAQFLTQTAEINKRRIILVMDEYDEDQGFHGALRQDPKRGEAVLARMRSFSQNQNWVVFMFIGATYFSDLPEPNLSKYFVHAHIIRVEYLSREASLQLIERPVPNFELRYEPGVPERIYELTVGHPHLLQSICSDLVDYANSKKKNPVGFSDLDVIIREKTVMKGEMPFTVFWDEFCEKPEMRKAVLAISKGQAVDVESPEVRSLLDYGYLISDGKNGYKMRVPLFADWVIRFGY